MKILLLSAYDAGSHRRFRAGLEAAFPDLSFTVVALPPRHYAWRAAGNALTFAARIPAVAYDRILACGPVDLASLRGLRPDLARVRTLLYLHENEFAYPANPREQGRVDRQLRLILALRAADRVAVNSQFNAATLLAGIEALFAALPDGIPADTLASIAARIEVLPVPLEDRLFAPRTAPRAAGPLTLVWNHRWEWDKGPDRLVPLVDALHEAGVAFRLHLLGERFRARPAAFDVLEARLPPGHAARGTFGTVEDRGAYEALLRASDVVLSTALHEFQGLSVLEAVASGCVPCVPDRLAYPEWIPAACRAPSHPDDPLADGRALAERLLQLRAAATPAPDLGALAWTRRRPDWARVLDVA
ncbi:MAG TPA: DUF3524 domain-containing protein [Pseudomonadales bacterium]|nr:DUF3524 domain-containing protein [Pseudomonadales bacterium]